MCAAAVVGSELDLLRLLCCARGVHRCSVVRDSLIRRYRALYFTFLRRQRCALAPSRPASLLATTSMPSGSGANLLNIPVYAVRLIFLSRMKRSRGFRKCVHRVVGPTKATTADVEECNVFLATVTHVLAIPYYAVLRVRSAAERMCSIVT